MKDTIKPTPPTRISPPEFTHRCPDPRELERLLAGWMQGDSVEQRETFEVLRRSLDEARPVGYKLFS